MAVAALLTESGAALAQRGIDDTTMMGLLKCRSGQDDAARLACYDRAVATLEASGSRAANPAEVRARQQAQFGLSATRAAAARSQLPQVDTLDGKVARVTAVDRIRFVVTLADGSVWRTTETTRVEPAVGDAVHVRRAALGSYLASFAKARSIRIERLR